MLRTEYVSKILRWMPFFNGMTSVNGCAERVTYVNTATTELRHSCESRKPSSPVSAILRWMPFFNGMTIRGGVAEKVTSVNNITFHTPSFW
ncbi:MAG: hypothetical protein GX556_14275 [Fibrobacter sp.]|nr:hypothetical protein [Fibrobacter sp.]